ncbi:MAG TPA: ABC transporter permease [Acidimicrobiales bacterium]|nr:ABC transporter permease [Acidimicrobiales bacterium]
MADTFDDSAGALETRLEEAAPPGRFGGEFPPAELPDTELTELTDAGLTTEALPAPEGGELGRHAGAFARTARVFVENKMAVAGLAVIVLAILFCCVGPFLYHSNQTNAQLALFNSENAAPTSQHLLGTDGQGFDILGRLMYGGQRSLLVGFTAAIMATVLGVAYGAISGFFGKWLDALMMRVVDTMLSIPLLFFLIVLSAIFHPSLPILILVIAFVSWLVPARLVRGQTLTLRVREYVQAVRVMGGSRTRIIFRHIIPNTMGTIIVNTTFQVADAILILAALGYLGLGVQPPQTDWGSMLANGVNYALDGYWWEIYPAFLAIVLVVMAFNFVGDALRDSLEVRLQQR